MNYLAPVPKQYVDESGIPYSGGTVSVYLHGTSELAEIYSDATGEALMENPCTLDSNGSWQCFVPSEVPLDYIVADADGNVVSSFINVVIPEGSGGSSSDMEVVGTPNEILVDRRRQKFVVALSSTIKNSISALADSVVSLLYGLASKADKVSGATNGHLAGLDSSGNLTDSGKKAADFATDAQGAKADSAIQGVKVNGTELSKDGNNVVDVPVPTASTATPLKDGTASVGSSTQWARGDHRHPTDDSREDVNNKVQSIDPTSTTEYGSSKAVADFVNSSVATNTATFLGNFSLADLGLTYPATEVQIASALNSHTWPTGYPTNNDYVYVEIRNPQSTIDDKVQRYKYRDGLTSWGYEYSLNNSSFTAEEKAAIDSGITSQDVTNLRADHTTLEAHVGDSNIHVTAADKTNWNSHVADTSNPHNVTKSQVGLGNVDNTSDLNKPISTAQQAALNTKQKVISIVTGAPIILDANGNMDLKISDGTFLDRLPYFEQIGDKQYKVCLMPDGKIWMCENLDYGSSGVYYNNDETTYGWNGLKYGKLYTWNEAVTVANSISGWHLPSADEWDALATAVGGSDVAGTKLKSTTGWTYVNGTDDFGFAGFPAGRPDSNSSFSNLGLDAYIWTATESSSTLAWYRNLGVGADIGSYRNDKTSYAISVRLVKD